MKRIETGQTWWDVPPGERNTICDVAGVTVGHATLRQGSARTGVTAIRPHGGDLFRLRPPAGVAVLNGFGKSGGLVQVAELGELETPILLTNTFGVAPCSAALIRQAIAENPEIGRSDTTVNPVVLECNDGKINDIQAMAVTEDLARQALAATGQEFAQGTVGAGTGMRSFGLAGGLGSASRRVALPGGTNFMLGALVLSNFGSPPELRVFGRRIGLRWTEPSADGPAAEPDTGSIIVIYATDAPMDSRQLTRLARRAGAALGRLGSFFGHGSGDIALAFSTDNLHAPAFPADVLPGSRLPEGHMDAFFRAGVEAAEEAVLNALWYAEAVEGYSGRRLAVLRDLLRGE